MTIKIFSQQSNKVSFEFFPPKTQQATENLYVQINKLLSFHPQFMSITYGADGSTRELTQNLCIQIKERTNIPIVAHLTCVNALKDDIYAMLQTYENNGIENIMALRGDMPKGKITKSDFTYAYELVTFIKENFPNFGIGVAGFPEGHPQSLNRLKEMDYLKQKVDAGADYICTQLFFDHHDYYDFCERCEISGITVPCIPGIMPIISKANFYKIAELAPRSHFPAPLLRSLYNAKSDNEIEKIGIDWAIMQVQNLLDHNVQHIHFYTLNHANYVQKILEHIHF